ncbi:hypothetical protein ABTD45_19640, partial [Acinetobacter baumannii]
FPVRIVQAPNGSDSVAAKASFLRVIHLKRYFPAKYFRKKKIRKLYIFIYYVYLYIYIFVCIYINYVYL